MSKLFKVASAAERRIARRSFVAHPAVGLYKSLGRATAGRGGRSNMRGMLRALTTPEVRDLMNKLNHGRVTKYARKDEQQKQLTKLLELLGPVGQVIRAAIGTSPSYTSDAFDMAANFIRAMGGEVFVGKGRPGHQRGLDAAKQILEEAGYTVQAPGDEPGDEQSEVEFGDAAGTQWLEKAEVKVSSSNVYSYAWSQETDNFGTLYVTFLAWHPGMKKASSAPGATYAYYGVPVAKYKEFSRAAKASAGAAVWDYLRVRGSVSDHQHSYELVGGTRINKEDVYIPRKATDVGYFRRAVQVPRNGRGSWQRSSLPSREFEPNRGTPNRGAPNRGR